MEVKDLQVMAENAQSNSITIRNYQGTIGSSWSLTCLPPPQSIMLSLTASPSMRPSPTLRQLVISRQRILPSTLPLRTHLLQPTPPINPTIALRSTRTRHQIQPIEINTLSIVQSRRRPRRIPLLGQEENVPQVRQDAARDTVVERRAVGVGAGV